MKDEQTTCTPCEQNFERKVNELVKEGEAPDAEQRAKKEAEASAQRLSQVRTVDRSERIRTYNYPQSRVSDHRIGGT